MHKRLIVPERVRHIPSQFSWLDHRLVRERYTRHCSPPALALYLFLVTVGDHQGLSYYGDPSICEYLKITGALLDETRQNLEAADLIAYQKPLYQVLALPELKPQRATLDGPRPIGSTLKSLLEGQS